MQNRPRDSSEIRRAWQRRIRRTQLRLNAGRVADAAAPLMLAAGLLGCTALLYLRGQSVPFPSLSASLGSAALTLGLFLVIAFACALPRFVSREEARTRLEASLPLHNSLAAAEANLRPWPSLPAKNRGPDDRLRWDWRHLGLPPLLALGLLTFPFFLPPPAAPPPPLPPNEPLAWENMEEWLEELASEEIADPDDLQAFQRELDALRETAPETWFDHSSLEATDSLQESLTRSVQELESNLSKSSQSLSLLEERSGSLPADAETHLASRFQDAVKGLESSDLALDRSLLEPLQDLEPSALGDQQSLSPELLESLRRNAESLRELLKEAGEESEAWARRLEAEGLLRERGSKSGPRPGQGSPKRGPGEAPMFYEDEPRDLGTENPERLAGSDPSRAAPGDLLGMDSSAPTPSPEAESPGRAGALEGTGRGGYQVWESSLLPSERTVLRSYFE